MNQISIWILVCQVAATMAMVGLIWFVQIVHYPLFSFVDREHFPRYEAEHQRLTTYVVVPWMLLELLTSVLLVWWRPAGVGGLPIAIGLGLLISIWLLTYTVQVPLHAALLLSYSDELHRKLVVGNWYRTFAWTTRGVLVLWMVHQVATRGLVAPVAESVSSAFQ